MVEKTKVLVPAATSKAIDRFFRSGLVKKRAEDLQDPAAFRLSIARRRYREGFTDKVDFLEELGALQVPPDQLQLEVIAGDLEAAYDYTMDLIATWRDAFRKGHIGIEKFAELISSVVVVPERARTYVARELAKLKPEEPPALGPIPKQAYETDAGKLDVDTIRRLRRRREISMDQEITALQSLGMSIDLSTSYAENDSLRLAKEKEEES